MTAKQKKLAVTMGDPAGVGPELCLELGRYVDEVVLFGHREILEKAASAVGKKVPQDLVIIEPDLPAPDFEPGTVSAATGRAAYEYLMGGIHAALSGELAGVVTCPINKAALNAAGLNYPGHTEILVEAAQAPRHAMMLTSEEITCSLVTTHIGLRQVASALEGGGVERIVEVIRLTAEAMRRLRGRTPRLGILGLNPHAGEEGLFGDEETRLVVPAMEAIKAELDEPGKGIELEGPFPPDTAFLPSIRSRIDAYVCLYHDQGLIPLKTLAFDEAVNVTLGLPFVRSSVDHGTALDIAWQGKVNPQSFFESLSVAKNLL